ncbi:MAG: hypothetical protein IJH52_01090 [Oscillospiraceae bacterium]|nr:hypothetical protein [Oscillospiraceae bacterium]
MSTYKIMNNSTVIGTLETCADGLYTIFTARCEPVLPRLRLHVFGEETHAYLGLMLPENGALYLRRRLSRLECAKLPAPILYAAGENSAPPKPEAWRPAPDGTLRRAEGGVLFVAVPRERVRVPGVPRHLLRVIDGREYLVFPL